MKTTLVPHPALGPVAICWKFHNGRPQVVQIRLPRPGRRPPRPSNAACPGIDALARSLRALLDGRRIRFRTNLLALSDCPPFQQDVLRALSRIPRGQVHTYGELAALLGKPGAARAVGNALAGNPFPLVFPCHRVVRAGGVLGGFGGGPDLKRALLALEGVAVDAAGRMLPAPPKIPARQPAPRLAQIPPNPRRSP